MLIGKKFYNGKDFVALEKFPKNKNFKVAITFVEEIDEKEEVRQFSAQTDAFSFWNDEREDLYQDFLTARMDEKLDETDLEVFK
jgi:hypothetical protein